LLVWFTPLIFVRLLLEVHDWLFALPFRIAYPTVITKLGCQVATAHTGSSDVLMGIYANSGGLPSTLLVSGSEVSIATTGEKEATISFLAQIGWYWLVWTYEDDDSGAVRFNVRTASNSFNPEWGTENGNEAGGILRVSRTYDGTLPATFPAVTGADIDSANMPDMWWRKGV
jgi:hypothetical protein